MGNALKTQMNAEKQTQMNVLRVRIALGVVHARCIRVHLRFQSFLSASLEAEQNDPAP
jgi:hypothetical protein